MTTLKIKTVEQLREIYKQPSDIAVRKQLLALDVHCQSLLALSPFVVLATNGLKGTDATPRGGPPGFVKSVDNRILLIPDWSGNNRLDSLTNILENPQVGLLFLVPGINETLRINGTAEIRTDVELLEHFRTDGHVPLTVLVVEVKEVYLHCAKAFLRANLWDEKTKVKRSLLPSLGEMLKDQLQLTDQPESQPVMETRYRKNLY